MKNLPVLLSAAGVLLLPTLAHADAPGSKNKKTAHAASRPAAVAPSVNVRSRRVVYYITDTPRTGSAIPMVYRKYDGHLDSAANAAVYGQTNIANSGAFDTATALTLLDTSITHRR